MNNYRPLTILTSMLGVYTKVLNRRLVEVVERHRLLGEVQNGFRKDRSGADSGFVLNTVLWKTVAKKRKVHVAFLDLTKAKHLTRRIIPRNNPPGTGGGWFMPWDRHGWGWSYARIFPCHELWPPL